MKLRSRFAVVSLGLLGLAACNKPAASVSGTDNPNISYEVLFNRQGCEVGRFQDAGRNVYVTICPSGEQTSSTSYQQSEGKTSYPVMNTQVNGSTAPTAVPVPKPPGG